MYILRKTSYLRTYSWTLYEGRDTRWYRLAINTTNRSKGWEIYSDTYPVDKGSMTYMDLEKVASGEGPKGYSVLPREEAMIILYSSSEKRQPPFTEELNLSSTD